MNYNDVRNSLQEGKTVRIRVKGNSMVPKIMNGDAITISPDVEQLEVGDIVFCKVKGYYYDGHLITAIRGKQYQISNNHGHVNGWITKKAIYGKIIKVEK